MYEITIDGQKFTVSDQSPTGEQILALVSKKPQEWELFLEPHNIPIPPSQKLDLKEADNTVFKTVKGKADRNGVEFPIIIKIDGTEYQVNVPSLTGEQILELAGKTYDTYSLNQKLKSGRRIKIHKEDLVDLTDSELDRFETAPLQAQQGITI